MASRYTAAFIEQALIKAMFANYVGSSRGELQSVDNVCHGASALGHTGAGDEKARVEANNSHVAPIVPCPT